VTGHEIFVGGLAALSCINTSNFRLDFEVGYGFHRITGEDISRIRLAEDELTFASTQVWNANLALAIYMPLGDDLELRLIPYQLHFWRGDMITISSQLMIRMKK
jgi:hypothetical protein